MADDPEGRAGTQNAVRDAVIAHLRRHPFASDTAAGVSRWWLGEPGVVAATAIVAGVLDRLVQQGSLQRWRLAGGVVLYRATPPARPQMETEFREETQLDGQRPRNSLGR